MGGLEEGGWNKRSWTWETERKWEAWRKLKKAKGDRHRKVKKKKKILVNRSRKEIAKE